MFRGVGPKTAASLLKQFGSIKNMYDRVDEIKNERIRNKIKEAEELLKKNIELVRLDDDIESDDYDSLCKLEMKLPDLEIVEKIAKEFELKNLTDDFAKIYNAKANPTLFDL